MMLPAKVTDVIRRMLRRRVARIIRLLSNPAAPDNAIANEARLIGEAGNLLDPEFLAGAWIDRWEREARRYARVCVWDGECEADATTDDGLCADHAAEQAREEAEVRAQVLQSGGGPRRAPVQQAGEYYPVRSCWALRTGACAAGPGVRL